MNCEVYEYFVDEKYHTHAQYIWLLRNKIVFALRADGKIPSTAVEDVYGGNYIRNNTTLWRRII